MNNSVAGVGTPTFRQRARSVVQTLNDIGPIWLPPQLRTEVQQFLPDVIHSLLGGVRVMRLTLALSRWLDAPIVPHFMDDWPATMFSHGQLGGQARLQMERVLEQILHRSPLCLTIGDDMRTEFERRLGRPCFVVGNSVDIRQYDYPTIDLTNGPQRLVMRYVGGLHLGRHEVIEAVAKAIEDTPLGSRCWELELFVPDHDLRRANRLAATYASVSTLGSANPDDVPGTLAPAHALLFLESQLPGVVDFTRLSVSTKVPQYLAARRPILVMGPQDQGSVRTLLRYPDSVYPGPHPNSARLRQSLQDLTGIVEQQADRRPAEHPDWFSTDFGQAATQERLRACLAQASDPRTAGAQT